VGIVGAGTMGNGIAQTAAVAGLKVVMIDVTDAALFKGVAALSSSLERLVSKGKPDVDARAAASCGNCHTAKEQRGVPIADQKLPAVCRALSNCAVRYFNPVFGRMTAISKRAFSRHGNAARIANGTVLTTNRERRRSGYTAAQGMLTGPP
jgi:hypothetical protein